MASMEAMGARRGSRGNSRALVGAPLQFAQAVAAKRVDVSLGGRRRAVGARTNGRAGTMKEEQWRNH